MIIKKITHKSRLSLTPLLRYMIDGMEDKNRDMMIAHNLPSFDLYDMTEAFLKNDKYRTDPRATVVWYHEILSFSPKDAAFLDNQKLEQITQEYINRRNPSSLCFAVSHIGDNHKHVHLCFGSVEYRSEKSLRMSNEVFTNLRLGMERWQRETFPELWHSIVYLDREQEKHKSKTVRQERHKRKNNEVQAKKRMGKSPLKKEVLAETLQQCYDQSSTPKEFIQHIKNAGLRVYERNGKAAGVIAARKYRFATLGITKSMLLSLDRFAKRQRQARQLSRGEGYERER